MPKMLLPASPRLSMLTFKYHLLTQSALILKVKATDTQKHVHSLWVSKISDQA